MAQEAMKDVAIFSTGRIFIRGFFKAAFGALFLLPALALGYSVFFEPKTVGDDRFVMLIPVVLLLLFGLNLPGGIGRMISAFRAKDYYLRAGPEGIAARLPRYKLFGRFRVLNYFIRWDDLAKVVDFTYRVNGIPTSRQLRITLKDRSVLNLDAFFFSESIATIQQRLLALQGHRYAA